MINITLTDAIAIISTIGASLFFFYKIMSGALAVNMSVKVKAKRQANDKITDYLVIEVKLEKGEFGSLLLYDIGAKVAALNSESKYISFVGIERQSWEKSKIVWDTVKDGKGYTSNPNIRITPTEKLSFSVITTTPNDLPCSIEVIILGKRDFSPFVSQWKSSAVSLPLITAQINHT